MTAAQLGVAGPNVGFRDGTLIRTPDGKVWAISTEQRRWIANQSAFNQLGYQGGGIVNATTAEAGAHEVGADIGGAPHPDGALVKSGGAAVWVVRRGIRYPVISEAAFTEPRCRSPRSPTRPTCARAACRSSARDGATARCCALPTGASTS